MSDNLVNNVLDEMERNNPQLNYDMGQQQQQMQPPPPQQQHGEENYSYSPVQPQHQVRMGEVMYDPRDNGNQAPTMQNNMNQNMASEPMVSPDEEDAAMEAPDLSHYGMEEEEGNMFEQLLGELKGPLVVAALVFVMSLPQVSSVIRNFLASFTTNPMYLNAAVAVLIGVVYFLFVKFLD